MPQPRGLLRSFSSQSHRTPRAHTSRKRKETNEQHVMRKRRTRLDYKREDGDESTDEHLCDRCRTIDFERIFATEADETVTKHGINVFDLGELPLSLTDTSCKLCSLFALIVNRNEQYESFSSNDWHLRAFTTGTLRNRSHTAASRAQDLSIVIALSRESDVTSEADRVECIDRGVVMPWHNVLELDPDSRNSCRIIACPKRIDYSRLRELLLGCDDNHLKCRARQEKVMSFPVRAKVIDCTNREVVLLTPASTYVALSYVWGPRKLEDLSPRQEHDSKLKGLQPATIEDAMSITKALGLRFLWVDRICIDQRQNADTQHQLTQMGHIYSHAYVTICALGDHDDVGISGVSFDRKRQRRVQTQDLTLSWTGPSLRRNLDFSKWRSRGWTYQESVLSRRCLFFTDHFVALVCDSETTTENISFNYFHTWSFNRESELYGNAKSWGQVLYPAQEFDKHLQEFQRRQLSFAVDTLNAFKGILSQLSVQSYWGIPIYKVVAYKKTDAKIPEREQEAGFIAGLCWKVKASSRTNAPDREDLPSWSWAGQQFARVIANCLARSYQLEVAHTYFAAFQANIRIKCADDSLVSLQQFAKEHTTSNLIPEQTRYLEIRSITIRWQGRIKPQKKTNWIEDGLDAQQVGENGWWREDYIGDLYLDPTYAHFTKPHENCGNQDQICKHIPWRTGTAVLLALDVKHAGDSTVARAIWLVVELTKDGSYRRRGIIVSRRSVRDRSPITCPTNDMLKTVLLG